MINEDKAPDINYTDDGMVVIKNIAKIFINPNDKDKLYISDCCCFEFDVELNKDDLNKLILHLQELCDQMDYSNWN